jgi:signal transduction histidine kinase
MELEASLPWRGLTTNPVPHRKILRRRMRLVDHGQAGDGVWSRSVWRAGQKVSFAPNQLIRQAAKLVTSAGDVIEELPTPIRAALMQAEEMESGQRNLLAAEGLNPTAKRIYALLSTEDARHIDDISETTGLNSSAVLATLFEMKIKGCGSCRGNGLVRCCCERGALKSNRRAQPGIISRTTRDGQELAVPQAIRGIFLGIGKFSD